MTENMGPERGEYAPSEAWLSYRYLPVVLKTLLEFTIRSVARTGGSSHTTEPSAW
jgi:hypothetical protein